MGFLNASVLPTSSLKGIKVPQNHHWHGRVCLDILQDKEETACCLAGGFGAKRVVLGTRRKLLPWVQGAGVPAASHDMAGAGRVPKSDDISALGKGTRICPVREERPPTPKQGWANKSREPQQSGCYLGAVRALTPRASLLLIRLMEADVV